MKSNIKFLASILAITTLSVNMAFQFYDNAIYPYVTAYATMESSDYIIDANVLNSSTINVELFQSDLSIGENIESNIVTKKDVTPKSSGETTKVNKRDWSQYSSDLFKSGMTTAQQTYYDRLNKSVEEYMNNTNLDACYVSAYNTYVVDGVKYNDLNIGKKEAFYIAEWFLYNNPQYYFLKPKFLTTNQAVYISCYDDFYDGDVRAEFTNDMFDRLDVLVDSISDDEVTIYDKVESAHNLVCDKVAYKGGTFDQSLYSSLIMNESVCAGYSELVSVLLNAVDVETVVCMNEQHAWNVVMLDDADYYIVDATWNDMLNSNEFFLCGQNTVDAKDTAKEEHSIGSYWSNFVPSVSLYDYKNNNSSDTTVSLNKPGISVEEIDDNSIRIKWSCIDIVDSYDIEIYNSDTGELVGKKTTSTNSLKISNVLDGQSFDIRCRTNKLQYNKLNHSDWSDIHYTKSVVDNTPKQPLNFTVKSISESFAEFRWVSPFGVDTYYFELSDDKNYNNIVLSGKVKSTVVQAIRLTPGTHYYGRLQSVKTVNGQEYVSDWVELEFDTDRAIVLDRPTGLLATDITNSSCRAIWNNVSQAESYDIQISSDFNFNSVIVGGNLKTTHVTISHFSPGTYYARVRAVSGKVYSDWTSVKFVIPSDKDSLFPPKNVRAVNVGSNAIRVKWDKSPSSPEYEIKIYSDINRKNLLISSNIKHDSVKISGLTKGNMYYISVRTVSDGKYSNWVNVDIRR